MPSTHIIPTLDDVAKAAGVSTATVSRCLNTSEKVSERSRLKVMKAVEMLGYTPNFGARAMAAKRTFTIGAIIPTMENAIFARGLQAFQETLYANGYTLLVSSTAYRPDVEAEQIKALIARGADGLLLIGYERDHSIYKYLERRGVPTLIAWAFAQDSALPTIGFDNRASMRALCDKVLDMGHKKIGFISGIIAGNDRASERLQGVKEGMRARGLDPNDMPVCESTYEIENGANAFETIMQGAYTPTVVMCGNDVLAVGAMQRAHEMGLKVPQDVSITGFDDIELARIVSPQLTTVHVPHREMGSRAAEELTRMVEHVSTGVSCQLDSSLRLRGSLRVLD
ncbi:LacI family DNA-binding transcriptional regulator [Pelagimonas varians]|uniref:Catabolite control protein A n=1 Tax=Pelagimonas varians TaxID=696760 RepID=A0A238K0Q3_9RHOB|nr:LacI family DNA-binding transcriptional regulator [Pelagimonas varians]PYG33192.1 LacI family transcriptional regulator [Pelagimonas varians]SMX35954.1 Catabolite control protein A [Pelagimonas varians]